MLVLSLPDVEGPENELRQDKKVEAPVLSWCIHQGRYGGRDRRQGAVSAGVKMRAAACWGVNSGKIQNAAESAGRRQNRRFAGGMKRQVWGLAFFLKGRKTARLIP